ncbi:hypothetical protein ACOSQ3_006998 [Xanthoceras sorbifolium]
MELLSSQSISKKAAKQEKLHRREKAIAAAAISSLSVEEEGPLANSYGDVMLNELRSMNKSDASKWTVAVNGKDRTKVGELTESMKDQKVLDSWLDPHDTIRVS